MMKQQLLFSSSDQHQHSLENFYGGENQNIIDALNKFLATAEFGCFYIYGDSGSGKSHLLKAICAEIQSSVYIDTMTSGPLPDEIEDLQSIQLLALDNFHHQPTEMAAMMLIYETLRQTGAKLLIASSSAPRALGLSLQDLESRLLAGQVFKLKLLDDDEKIQALKLRASLRSIAMSDEVINYVIQRYPRDFKSLFALLDKLDEATLTSQRRLTVPFIKQLEQSC